MRNWLKSRINRKRITFIVRDLFMIIICSALVVFILPTKANADISSAPKGVDVNLWSNFRSIFMFNVDSQNRNLRWTNSPVYYVKGSPTSDDVNTLNDTLNTIANSCTSIRPWRTSQEPNEGVILNFIPTSQFKNAIPTIPESITDSYLYWTYYVNRGITKTEIVIANEIKDKKTRDYLIRLRVLQGFGFHKLTNDSDYSFLNSSLNWENSKKVSDKDREMLIFYCSNLVRAWDTEVETQKYINNPPQVSNNQIPVMTHKVELNITDYGANLRIFPSGGDLWQNQVKEILVQIQTKQGIIVWSQPIEMVDDYFSTRESFINNLESRKYYDIYIYNKNNSGYGNPQKLSFQTGNITTNIVPKVATKPSVFSAIQEVTDSKQAANDAYEALKKTVESCNSSFAVSEFKVRSELTALSLNKKCTNILGQGEALWKSTSSIASATNNSTQDQINSAVDDWNAITDKMNQLCEDADAANAEIQDAIDAITRVLDIENANSDFNLFMQNEMKKLSLQVSLLPTKSKNSLLRADEYLDLQKLVTYYIEAANVVLDFRNNRYDIYEANRLLSESDTVFSLDALKVDYSALQNKLPKYVCVKGKNSLEFKSKCQTGYTKKQIK